MANGIDKEPQGLLGNIGDFVQGLITSPIVQGIGTAAAFGFNPALGLLVAPGIKNARDRKAVENELMRQEILGRRRRIEAQQGLTSLINQDTAVSSPIGLLNMEGGVDMLPAGRRVPAISTPGGQREALSLISQAAPQATMEAIASQLLSQPTAPQFRTDVGKLFGDLEIAESQGNTQAAAALRAAIDAQLKPKGVDFDDVRSVRRNVIKDSQPFLIAKQGFDRVRVGALAATPAGDIALTFGYMKILDPTSVVREGEQATVQNAGGIAERIRNTYNRLLTGERLTPEQRADFLSQSRSQFVQVVDQQQRVIADARGFATRNELPATDVVPEFVLPSLPELADFESDEGGAIGEIASAVEGAVEAVPEIAASAARGARGAGARIAEIGRMSLEKLQKLDPEQMTREQLEAAARRFEELTGG